MDRYRELARRRVVVAVVVVVIMVMILPIFCGSWRKKLIRQVGINQQASCRGVDYVICESRAPDQKMIQQALESQLAEHRCLLLSWWLSKNAARIILDHDNAVKY